MAAILGFRGLAGEASIQDCLTSGAAPLGRTPGSGSKHFQVQATNWNDLSSRVAVVTGAARGIGRALATRLAHEGARLVLVDVDEPGLLGLAQELPGGDRHWPAVRDVSLASDLQRLAEEVDGSWGPVHLLFNNAGVTRHTGQAVWELSSQDWDWLVGVNLMGVVNGLRAFLPNMIQHGHSAHVINTVSYAGFLCGGGAYGVTKQALMGLSESLLFDLQSRGLPIGVSCLCPGLVATSIVDCEGLRPSRWKSPEEFQRPEWSAYRERVARATADWGIPAAEVAELALQGIRQGRFYLLTHPPGVEVEERTRALHQDRAPHPPPRPSVNRSPGPGSK